MVVYTLGMVKRPSKLVLGEDMDPKVRVAILMLLIAVGAGAILTSIYTIVIMPRFNPGLQRGVSASGFSVFVEENGDLGMKDIVDKTDVESALGKKAKVVSNVEISKVLNFDDNRGQTATFRFVRPDGIKASVYIDVMHFKSTPALEDASVTTNTVKAGTVNGNQAYYLHAQTLGSEREYRLLVVRGLRVYKFVMVQPSRNVTIDEVASMAVMKKIAAKARL